MDEPASLPIITLPPDYLQAIGALISNAAAMELLIEHMTAVFLRMHPALARKFLGETQSTKRKISTLKFIHDKMAAESPDLIETFSGIYPKLTSAQANRSKIAHAKWGAALSQGGTEGDEPSAKYYIVYYPEGGDDAVTDPMPLATLQRYANDVSRVTQELEQYFRTLNIQPKEVGQHDWPPTHPKNVPAGRKEGR